MNTSIPLCYFEKATYLIFSSNVPPLVHYTHISALLITFILGIFILLRGERRLSKLVLFFTLIPFWIWTGFNLIIWASNRSDWIMFMWSVQILLEPFIYTGMLYLLYAFVGKGDTSFGVKLIWGIILLPLVIIAPTKYTLPGFNLLDCIPIETYYSYYSYVVEIIFIVWIIVFSIKKYKATLDKVLKKQILFLFIGIVLFLLTFSSGNIVGSFTNNWNLAQVGLFGVPFFIGFLVYSIVKFKTFEIKLISTQALVIALIALIGSQFFFIQNNTNRILNSITFILSAIFGYYLVHSVKIEVERKEQLQHMTNELTDANDKLRKMDNTKSEFISIASHQLRTPLTAIKGFGSLLLEGFYGKLDTKQYDAVNKIYQSNTRLINLVEDLLDVSRIESGRMEFKFEKNKLEDICQEIYETFIIRAKEHGLSLKMNIPKEPLPEVMIDGEKIKEVISNLIDNAIKYTLKGGVKISLSQRDNFVRLTVTDTGIGIPPDEIPYLFVKFSRGKDISRLNTTGTGLGLYVGKSIVEANHGKIWIESEGAGKGSKFVVELPVG